MRQSVCHVVSVDLGQTTDPSALCVLEQTQIADKPAQHQVRDLRRWHLGVPYTKIVEDVLDLLARPELIAPTFVLDQSGVGRPVTDMFRERVQCSFVPITITSGMTVNRSENGDFRVPKVDIVGVLQALLGQRRLHIARSLKDAAVLVKELQDFRTKITPSMNETFAAREGTHDDLCLAVGCAAWAAEQGLTGEWTTPDLGPDRSLPRELRALQDRLIDGGIDWQGGTVRDDDDGWSDNSDMFLPGGFPR